MRAESRANDGTDIMENESCGPYLIITNRTLDRAWCYSEHGIIRLWQAATNSAHILKDADVEDSIVGKAAALLMVYGGVKSVKAGVLSESGKDVLDYYNIPCEYQTLVPYIVNRKGDGVCPMEQAVLVCTPSLAVVAIKRKLIELGMMTV